MERPRHILREELAIHKLVTFYYREMSCRFSTKGEKHDFWEFVYVDSGELEIVTDSGRYCLSQGEMIFYKPNQFHKGNALHGSAPNMIIISFECASPCMAYFEDKRFRLNEYEYQILSRIVREGMQAFDPPIDSPDIRGCPRSREGASFGGEQIIRNYLEILLIELIRYGERDPIAVKPSSAPLEAQRDELVSAIIRFLQSNLAENLNFDQLCKQFAVSRTRLKTLFRLKTGSGVMEYFNRLKIEQGKRLIREEAAGVSEIAEKLGYESVQSFSKQFKRITGRSPSDYARSVKARAETGLAAK
ncbi:MAG: transcriptional regulator, AraC family [Paenibacillus sp.]|jgi:AraC-like DNA-binding protein|nr:transcriptional regulator, AraC family [Paenibacillus sp.]